jgi:cell division transport system permease protein
MRAKFVLTEAATGLWRNVTMTVAMILTTAISLALLGAGGLLFVQVEKVKDLLFFKVEVTVFLDEGVTQDQRDTLKTKLEGDDLVDTVEYESRDEAYKRFKELFKDSPDLVNNVKPEALPESFRVKLKDPRKFEAINQAYSQSEGVDKVSNQQQLVGKMFKTIDAVKNTTFVVALIQGIAALLLIANTIQVAAYSRRREVGIMKLVGASNWYVRLPFILEAAVAGLIGAALAWIALLAAKWLLLDGALAPVFDSGIIPKIPWSYIIATGPLLGLFSVLIAGVAGWATLRFYVKV